MGTYYRSGLLVVEKRRRAEKRMDRKSNGVGYSEKDNGVIIDDVFQTEENNTIRGKFESCFGRRRSLVFRIALLALILLIVILLIIFVCAFDSSIVGQLKIMNEQVSESQKQGVEEMDNLKTKVTELSDSMGKMCTMCPVGWRTIGSSCYYLFEEMRTWYAAQGECYKANSFLAIIKDRNESDSLNTLLGRSNRYWIGLRRDVKDIHIWKWTDGSEVTFTNWGVNEPNYLRPGEHCGENLKGAWNDMDCTTPQNYLCEKNRFC
ncbi:CD209 antigen-like protein C [Phyllobates terribilis]|uniref:CD209 antigen-like protein C n=1 Tax=Phyllobates terribilis TaxID=111132 RepID=UPI003CCB2B1F